jgi:Fe-Mn family superoxide dismutase
MDLPYDQDALAPHMSAETLKFHHGKHHATYVSKLNDAIKDTPMADLSLEEIIEKAAGDDAKSGLFNNAAQVWNHDFFWNCMKPGGGGKPDGELLSQIESDFGSFDSFAEEFKAAAAGRFGSGWAWLVLQDGKLNVVSTQNADLPMVHGQKALLTCDVWEHAYYLDYQNERPRFVASFLDNLVNWDYVASQYAAG